jgi:hypothetical protein
MLKSAAKGLALSQAIHLFLSDPVWERASQGKSKASVEAKRRAVLAGVQLYKTGKGAWKMGRWTWNVLRGENMGRTALEIGAGLADVMAAQYVQRVLQVHGMGRFARGLGASGDLSPYAVRQDGSTPCASVSHSY